MRFDHLLVDLDRVRDSGLLAEVVGDRAREKFNLDNRSSFIHLSMRELIAARAVIDADVETDSRWSARIASPAWYARFCERQSRAVWRGQITEAEASHALALMHGVAMTLPPPDGWAPQVYRGSWWDRPR